MQLTTEDENLTPERLARAIILEEIRGEDVLVRIKNSSLTDPVTNKRVQTVYIEGDEEDAVGFVKELLPQETLKAIADHESIDEVRIFCRVVREEHTVLGKDVVIFQDMESKLMNGNVGLPSPKTVPTLALQLGMQPPTYKEPPVSLLLALSDGDEEALQGLRERIRQFPSMYGKPEEDPEYFLVVRPLAGLEERDLKWHI